MRRIVRLHKSVAAKNSLPPVFLEVRTFDEWGSWTARRIPLQRGKKFEVVIEDNAAASQSEEG